MRCSFRKSPKTRQTRRPAIKNQSESNQGVVHLQGGLRFIFSIRIVIQIMEKHFFLPSSTRDSVEREGKAPEKKETERKINNSHSKKQQSRHFLFGLIHVDMIIFGH